MANKQPPLIATHLARKPLEGTVAQNALLYGTGSLNIDECRISPKTIGAGNLADNPHLRSLLVGGRSFGVGETGVTRAERVPTDAKGRWPANVILQHIAPSDETEGCRLVGTKRVVGSTGTEGGKMAGKNTEIYNDTFRGSDRAGERVGYTEDEGKETVDAWACVEGCPVVELDDQSGITTNTSHHSFKRGSGTGEFIDGIPSQPEKAHWQMETGGASRYFKQSSNPYDLIEYLRTMISTPDKAAFVINMDAYPEEITTWEDGSMVGLVVVGEIKQEHAEEFLRVLAPGGHILRIAPPSQPTGHTGAILLEDAGFEIRDCILLVQGPGRLHYVPKAGRKEREAGCHSLPSKKGYEAVERAEGSAGVDNPRAGAGRTAKEVHNFHPTVKTIALMERLLADVPKDAGPILDPFMGSGTTGIACSKTGHDFVGIEREENYLAIADARIRHWDRAYIGWHGAEIQSDLKAKEEEVVEMGLFDIIGND